MNTKIVAVFVGPCAVNSCASPQRKKVVEESKRQGRKKKAIIHQRDSIG